MKTIVIYYIILAVALSACKDETGDTNSDRNSDIQQTSFPLTNTEDLDILLEEIGDARYVLLGEASHGTSEFYTWRAEISKRLIEEKGFTIIGVEGDWPDLSRFNQYINGSKAHGNSARDVLSTLDRWPTWMWANEEVAELGEWLKNHNHNGNGVNFYGLDVYSLWDSMQEVLSYLQEVDPASAQLAQNAITCFGPYQQRDEFDYARDKANNIIDCADELANLLANVEQHANASLNDASFNALQNARIAVNAERYYSTAVSSNAESWNVRDRHMVETINSVVAHHGDDSKIIIWEHNTHVGDARATDMKQQGMVNVGQLVREQHGNEGVYIVGFGTYKGSVIASSSWGANMQKLTVPAADRGSWEATLHQIEPADKIIITEGLRDNKEFMQMKGHRAIGVVYNPYDEYGNYVPTVLPDRYDAFIFLDETEALHPIINSQSGRKKTRKSIALN